VTIRAVLFDVGGPIDTEVIHERLMDRDIAAAVKSTGLSCSEEDVDAASEHAVATFAPNAYAAMVWRLCAADRDRAAAAIAHLRSPRTMARRLGQRGGIELRPGIGALLRDLHARGPLLGLAANQPSRIVDELDRFGIGGLFAHREVTGHHGYSKPDTRLFLRACDDLGVEPAECIMVGDRIDNDIVPARVLGMRTVLFRTGRHASQQPRSLDDLPDHEVWTVSELAAAIETLLAAPAT
jgi:HAD superfamily hydrolase (TIGR01509 family)